jgi:hypothetical protein
MKMIIRGSMSSLICGVFQERTDFTFNLYEIELFETVSKFRPIRYVPFVSTLVQEGPTTILFHVCHLNLCDVLVLLV